jgi:hypothetical protein
MNIPLKNLVLLAALALAFSLGMPAAALAGSGSGSPTAGVHVDPGSPVAKEYALPLATARGAPADTGSNGSLFGTGITKRKSRRPSGGTSTASEPASSTPVNETVPAMPTSNTTATQPVRPAHRHHRHRAARKPERKPAGKHARGSIPAGRNATAPPTALKILHPGTGLSWLWMMLAALAVLALGSGGAFLLVRTRPREADPHPN